MPLLAVPGKWATTIYYEVVGDGPPASLRSRSEPARGRARGGGGGSVEAAAAAAREGGGDAPPPPASWLGRLLTHRRAAAAAAARAASPEPTPHRTSRSPSHAPKHGSEDEEEGEDDADAAADDPRPRVVFIMGLGATHGCWDPQVDELLAWGAAATADGSLPPAPAPTSNRRRPSAATSRPPMRALLLDNRGVGGSGVPRPGRAYSSSIMAGDVLAVMVCARCC